MFKTIKRHKDLSNVKMINYRFQTNINKYRTDFPCKYNKKHNLPVMITSEEVQHFFFNSNTF